MSTSSEARLANASVMVSEMIVKQVIEDVQTGKRPCYFTRFTLLGVEHAQSHPRKRRPTREFIEDVLRTHFEKMHKKE